MGLQRIGKIPTRVNRLEDALKVTAKDYNTLVNAFNAVVPEPGTAKANTIEEFSSGAGVLVDGVLLKDGAVSMSTQTLAAAGSTQEDAAQVTGQLVFVTEADATKGVKLPAVTNGKNVIIVNTANAVLKIYPASGEKIQGGTEDANISLAAYCIFIGGYKADGDWYGAEITAGAVV